MHHAIIRECLKETGYEVIPIRFAALCEEICEDQILREKQPEYAHKMLHIFLCKLNNESRKKPAEQDSMQIACVWIDLHAAQHIKILPKLVGEHILEIINGTSTMFLGSEHIAHNHG